VRWCLASPSSAGTSTKKLAQLSRLFLLSYTSKPKLAITGSKTHKQGNQIHKLSEQEVLLKRDLKNRYLAMAAIEKLRARQISRLKYLKAGDASSKNFF